VYLHESALDLSVRRGALREAAPANGVDLVHEDHARLVVLCVASIAISQSLRVVYDKEGEAKISKKKKNTEHLADDTRALSDVLVDDGR
jgi:hypothetical protein